MKLSLLTPLELFVNTNHITNERWQSALEANIEEKNIPQDDSSVMRSALDSQMK